ncbi:MAG TPA: c-type cytochrome [Labilithrix sp.]
MALVVLVVGGGGIYACSKASTFDASMAKVYDVPVPKIERSTDPDVLARGKHLANAVAPCTASLCHGADVGGGKPIVMGPVATLNAPNITAGGLGAAYTDGELARLLRHGIKKDGRSLTFMPVQDFAWLPDSDIAAIVSYLRTLPSVDRPNGDVTVGVLGKVLDVNGQMELCVARQIDHDKPDIAPAPSPTAAYGKYITRLCTGCHGHGFSGGPLPGAPKSMPVPKNITPHETGLKDWTYDDFDKLLTTGMSKSGKQIKDLMPIEAFGQMSDLEKHAVWEYLRTLPPLPFGNR